MQSKFETITAIWQAQPEQPASVMPGSFRLTEGLHWVNLVNAPV